MTVGDLVTVRCEFPLETTVKVKGKTGMIIKIIKNFETDNCLVRFTNGDEWVFSPDDNEIRLATDEEIRNALVECL